MKKKIILMSIAGILVLTAVIGGTVAGFTAKSEEGKTDITTKALGITLIDDQQVPMCRSVEEVPASELGMPGDEVAMGFHVTNDIPDGYDLYTRVTVYKYWDDRSLDAKYIGLFAGKGEARTELTAGTEVNDWIIWYVDEEQMIAYYKRPLAANESTLNILDSLSISPEISNDYTGKTVMFEIEADAVQKAVAEKAIPAEWGVYASFDDAGNIVSITE